MLACGMLVFTDTNGTEVLTGGGVMGQVSQVMRHVSQV